MDFVTNKVTLFRPNLFDQQVNFSYTVLRADSGGNSGFERLWGVGGGYGGWEVGVGCRV